MNSVYERQGLRNSEFNIGDKVQAASPNVIVGSLNEPDDIFTVVESGLPGALGVVNDRTGYGYMMVNGNYCHAETEDDAE